MHTLHREGVGDAAFRYERGACNTRELTLHIRRGQEREDHVKKVNAGRGYPGDACGLLKDFRMTLAM